MNKMDEQKKLSEEYKLTKRIRTHFQKGLVQYSLIDEGDKILIALSGGKDSLALLELLAERSKVLKPRFTVEAAHVVMTNIKYESDHKYLEEFAASHGVKLHIVETSFDPTTDNRKSPCFLCSWNRRKALFMLAKELGCNKIALGHHQDDILQTMLMNITFQGAFSTMPPKLVMRKFDMTIIRPMCLVHEADLKRLAELHGYQKLIKNCPYETDSHRSDIKQIFAQLELMNPEARYSLWNSMNNIQTELLPQAKNN